MIGDDKLFAPLPANKRPVSTGYRKSVGWQANKTAFQKRYQARTEAFKRHAKREATNAAR